MLTKAWLLSSRVTAAYVSEISIKDLEDVFEVRETLGGLAASIAAVKASDEDKASFTEASQAR